MASVDIPTGDTSARVTVIDTGARMTGSFSFIGPPVPGHDHMSAPAYVFLVEHTASGRRVFFDLGLRQKFEEYAPVVKAYHKAFEVKEGVEVSDFLQDRGVDLSTIEAIIWRQVSAHEVSSRY
ncbi:MAG: hypothetical protein MMC23_006996 [Stictis urceolatum]|nr:hypothetical protein [Stictis urceolata]